MVRKTKHTFFETYEITAKPAGAHVLITGGVHGDEFEPMLACMNLIRKLPRILQEGKVTVLPVVNTSAFTLGQRCADDGKDLARTFPGKAAGSFTQRLAYSLNQLIKTADYLIDLHTGGSLFTILPLCGYMLHPNKEVLAKQQQMARAFGMPIIWGTDAQAQGRTLSAARDFNIPAIYAECRGGLAITNTTISQYEKGCLNVLTHLGLTKSGRRPKNKPIWIEDYTPGEGHLQSKMPSPADGIFMPVVSIGQRVRKGSLIGYTIDPAHYTNKEIKAQQSGIVFMLRISAKVTVGDSLGGILPVSRKGKKIIYAR
ncbi:MAG TPA: M14 family metallopeptidase [Flavisolibacter sp.]|nr:M14 family metallopeptidase [Flavisolibacter sp.]